MSFDIKRMLHKEINVGLKERNIRYGAGAATVLASVFWGNIPLLIIGGILIYTGFTRWCPAYSGLGKSTVDPNEPAPSSCGEDHTVH